MSVAFDIKGKTLAVNEWGKVERRGESRGKTEEKSTKLKTEGGKVFRHFLMKYTAVRNEFNGKMEYGSTFMCFCNKPASKLVPKKGLPSFACHYFDQLDSYTNSDDEPVSPFYCGFHLSSAFYTAYLTMVQGSNSSKDYMQNMSYVKMVVCDDTGDLCRQFKTYSSGQNPYVKCVSGNWKCPCKTKMSGIVIKTDDLSNYQPWNGDAFRTFGIKCHTNVLGRDFSSIVSHFIAGERIDKKIRGLKLLREKTMAVTLSEITREQDAIMEQDELTFAAEKKRHAETQEVLSTEESDEEDVVAVDEPEPPRTKKPALKKMARVPATRKTKKAKVTIDTFPENDYEVFEKIRISKKVTLDMSDPVTSFNSYDTKVLFPAMARYSNEHPDKYLELINQLLEIEDGVFQTCLEDMINFLNDQ